MRLMPGYVWLRLNTDAQEIEAAIHDNVAVAALSLSLALDWLVSQAGQDMESEPNYNVSGLCYCTVPTVVIGNCGIPFGLAMSPTEKTVSHQMLHEHMRDVSPNDFEAPRDLAVLSDAGAALVSFARSCGLQQSFRFRHVLE
jgi:hypothetical protein